MKFAPFLFAASLGLSPGLAHADQIFVLSGGGSPLGNHYSQYLQTKTLTDQLRSGTPNTEISVMFGSGNRTGQPAPFADVHKQTTINGRPYESIIPGFIDGNQMASRQNVLNYFASGKTSSMRAEETFFFLVSDHGSPNETKDGATDTTFANNCINTWGFIGDPVNGTAETLPFAGQCFSTNDLKTQLTRNVSAGRTVFAMSQCFAGGFHRTSVNLDGAYPTANPKICGFTAVTEDTTASGCTADVDGPYYQGYERSFTEQLTGVDVVSSKRLRPARKSLLEVHQEATLEDRTKDIPLSTSDYYLSKWAGVIEAPGFVPRVPGADFIKVRAALNLAIDDQATNTDPGFLAKKAFFKKNQDIVSTLYPEYASVLGGSIEAHRKLLAAIGAQIKKLNDQYSPAATMLEMNRTQLMGVWSRFVESGQSHMTPAEAKIERVVFAPFDSKYGYGYGADRALLIMALKATTEPAQVKVLTDYRANREALASEWALQSGIPQLADIAKNVNTGAAEVEKISQRYLDLTKREGLVRRLLIYRQVLGAWNALALMGDRQGLTELAGLTNCETARLQ